MATSLLVFFLTNLFWGNMAQTAGLKSPSVHQENGFVSPGGSVTLNCTVHTGTCDGEHSVYWFKDSQPIIVYTYGDRNSQCERKPEIQKLTCIYNLPMENLNLSHAGTYYCAVASCGQIVFGKGIQLNFEYKVDTLVFVYSLCAALILNTTFSVFLAFLLFKLKKKIMSQSTMPQSGLSVDSKSYEDMHRLHYSSIRFNNRNMMTSLQFVLFYLTWLMSGKMAQTTALKFSSVRQESDFISAKTGQNLTLRCFYDDDIAARFYWYKQTLGKEPRLVSIFYKFESNGTFYDEFKNNPRFTLITEKGINHLMIRGLQTSDSATYFCASSYSYKFEFANGTTVSVKGSGLNIPALVHQSVSETVQPGGSVTLNCTVQTGTCDEEHSVYWFGDSGESYPGIIYTHGDKNNQCERKREKQTRTCVYNLPMKNLTRSHAGTYYCAVASCGHILFGNGTNVDVKYKEDSHVSLYFLSGALALTTTLSGLLTLLLCSINKRNCCQWKETNATTNAEVHRNEENLHYAALRKHDAYRSRRQMKTTDSECIIESLYTGQSNTAFSKKSGDNIKTLVTQVSFLNTMAAPKVALFLTCLFSCKIAQMTEQSPSLLERDFKSATVGGKVTLTCFIDSNLVSMSDWYKQPLGQRPRLISSFYVYRKNGIFYDECKDNPRFTLDTEENKNHLIITALQFSDAATYFCANTISESIEFKKGIVVSVKGSGLNIPVLVHQSVSETIQPGGSATLDCTVHTGTCDEKHSVYWFKDSEESHPGIIYTHGDRNNQFEMKPETQTHTCVYNLPVDGLNRSHAGTYYCAVASCGHILFGNGTGLHFEDAMDSRVSVYFLSGALALTTTLSVLLTFILCLVHKRKSCQCAALLSTNTEVPQNEENIHYAALKKHKVNRSTRQKNTLESECVYTSIKQ
ncbi:hypothetical protein Q5P01_002243 [Channa striata]|uniref:Ig-like domain-containing protein n=1 Tax=Channa striata TaxID=64152 RepID=A0AA88NQQ9_CHASR|nr:hypothetical protein Q5P01_002243 [Channa striata]